MNYIKLINRFSNRNPSSLRRLWVEKLESRQLFAADIASPYVGQNKVDPYDVDQNNAISPLDALWIANYLNGSRNVNALPDIDGDGEITETDFELECEHINRMSLAMADIQRSPDFQGESGGLGAAPNGGGGGSKKPLYVYSRFGNAADATPVLPLNSSGLALVGGGTDVDEVFRWMGGKAQGGDFLVLRATGTNAYNSYIDRLASFNSVATLIVPDLAAAFDPFVAATISKAEGIFFAGGDQANYVNYWSGTPLETAVYGAISRHVPVGGTSAGLAILGDYDFSAINGTITSSEAIANPMDARITLDNGLINEHEFEEMYSGQSPLVWLNSTVTDSHFQQRDRMGRLEVFLGRLDADGLNGNVFGIGINEQTALLVEQNGLSRVVGNAYSRKTPISEQLRSVYFLDATSSISSLLTQSDLDLLTMDIDRATYDPISGIGDTFDLDFWSGTYVDSYSTSFQNGVLTSSQAGGLIY